MLRQTGLETAINNQLIDNDELKDFIKEPLTQIWAHYSGASLYYDGITREFNLMKAWTAWQIADKSMNQG